jgi:citrate lyase subunit beta/citryl-CoA lyase
MLTRLRSWMFVPGNRQRYLDKCAGLPVDAVILDLEDGVAPSTQEAARGQIAAALEAGRIQAATYLRINQIGTAWSSRDIEETVRPGLSGVCVPKVESVEEIATVSARLDTAEARWGIEPGSIRLLLAVESALGLLRAAELAAASPRVSGLMLGAEDFALDVGLSVQRADEARELLYARSALVVAARSAQVGVIDGVFPDFADLDGLREDALQARRLGFDGKTLFHPGQIGEINRIFLPTAAELTFAREVVSAFEEATARGDGAVAVRGQLIDLPIVKRAQNLLDLPVG